MKIRKLEIPFRRKKEKKLKTKKYKTLNKKNFHSFFKEITKSVDLVFSGQESKLLEKAMEKELDLWLKATIFADKELDVEAIKIGICLGIKESLRKINEAEEFRKVSYIS